jgi:protoheme IX farnesyltransferase
MLGIGLLSSSAAVINHVVDHKIDSVMARTFNRPVAKGKVSPKRALAFAFVIGAIGFVSLAAFVNMLTAWLTLASLVGYAVIYTSYLKRATPQNIVIGGLAGAIPPLLGCTFGLWQFIEKKTTQKLRYPCYLLLTASNSPKPVYCYIRYYFA